jgi:hypothetical protein
VSWTAQSTRLSTRSSKPGRTTSLYRGLYDAFHDSRPHVAPPTPRLRLPPRRQAGLGRRAFHNGQSPNMARAITLSRTAAAVVLLRRTRLPLYALVLPCRISTVAIIPTNHPQRLGRWMLFTSEDQSESSRNQTLAFVCTWPARAAPQLGTPKNRLLTRPSRQSSSRESRGRLRPAPRFVAPDPSVVHKGGIEQAAASLMSG